MSSQLPPSSTIRSSPLSPGSPPFTSHPAKNSPLFGKARSPQTPLSPPLMSVSTQSHASNNFSNSQSSPATQTTTSHGQPLSSPPSSTPMSAQPSQQPTVSTTNSFPTPASSVSGHLMSATAPDDIDVMDRSGGDQALQTQELDYKSSTYRANDFMDTDQPEHRRTDHDRQNRNATSPAVKDENTMDTDQRLKSSVNLNLESLQNDIGSAFHLCKKPHTRSGPDPSLDLISLYGLGAIGRSVMRADPVTGEKINRLRKSYEGKLKGLGLAGRNKPVKHEPGMPGGLRQLTMWPEEEWQNQKVFGKEMKVADMDSALYKLQMRAMKMEPGPVPNHEYWEDVLGYEKPAKHVNIVDATKKPLAQSATSRAPQIQTNGVVAAGSVDSERIRPSRGKKRHYDDNSFVGYGEGYADDDDDGQYYSNGEDGRSGKKKRKKDHMSKVSPTIPERTGTYGVGMYGIGAR